MTKIESSRVALVTGAGRGIGRSVAEELAKRGHRVALVARNEAELESVAATIKSFGGTSLSLPFDLANLGAIEELTTKIKNTLGPVEIIINNAAIAGPFGPSWEVDPAQWTKAVEINLISPFLLSRACLPDMLERNWGRIINISSGAARNPLERGGAYSTTKAGLDMISRQLGVELEGSGVVVISFYPGIVDTGMQTEIRSQPEERVGQRVKTNFQNYFSSGQLQSPESVGKVIAVLAGAAGETFRGQVITISDPSVKELQNSSDK